jgi:hypothetical protein
MKKGVQGRLKASTDQIGRQFNAETEYTSAWKTDSSGNSITTEQRKEGGETESNMTQAESVTKGEKETWGTAPATGGYSAPTGG